MSVSRCRKKVAILGATGHIAKGLIANFSLSGDFELCLFARSPQGVSVFLDSLGLPLASSATVLPFADFGSQRYHAVVNCVGIGSPAKLRENPLAIFEITESFDRLVLEYLGANPETLYVNLSSGATYGTDFSAPPGPATLARFNANGIDPSEHYGIAKLNSEAKHRALPHFNIVDLRVFGYFSRFIDLNEQYLLTEMVECLKNGVEFVTGPADIRRDYVHPDDLADLIRAVMGRQRINEVFDVYSAAPVGKFEIIEHFTRCAGLRCRIEGEYSPFSATGAKSNYFSDNRRAEMVGYQPRFTSLECIASETEAILAVGGRNGNERKKGIAKNEIRTA